MKKVCRRGRIIPNGVSLEKHENDTVVFFTNLGYEIELIPPILTPNTRTPDIIMCGLSWEMKSPLGNSKNAIERSFRKAAKQSENIIIDLRRTNFDVNRALEICKKLFDASRRVRRLKIITNNQGLQEYTKR